MPIITNYPITLDVHEVLSQVSISVPQDKARRISATLTENGSALYLPDGCRAVFSATKADGTTVNNDCIIEHNTIIRYDFTEQTTAAVGKVECCFKVYGLEGEYLYGPIFTLVVYENKAGDVTFSEDEKNFLDRIFAAEESRISAELLRDDAERARGAAEAVRAASEQERVTAENARKAALVDNLTTDDPGKYLSARMGKKLNEEKVPTTRTVNKKPLSADIDLTAADVGAAPAGFGLGTGAVPTTVDKIDGLLANGWYYTSSSTGYYIGSVPIYFILLRVDSWKDTAGNRVVKHTLFNDGSEITRYWREGTWYEWEWVNPPMEVGVEYRTTEKWNEKAVYVKAFNITSIATGTLSLPASNVEHVIDWGGVDSNGAKFPFYNKTNGDRVDGVAYKGSATTISIVLYSETNLSHLSAKIWTKYTKTTE